MTGYSYTVQFFDCLKNTLYMYNEKLLIIVVELIITQIENNYYNINQPIIAIRNGCVLLTNKKKGHP